jgi:hypothetical protein
MSSDVSLTDDAIDDAFHIDVDFSIPVALRSAEELIELRERCHEIYPLLKSYRDFLHNYETYASDLDGDEAEKRAYLRDRRVHFKVVMRDYDKLKNYLRGSLIKSNPAPKSPGSAQSKSTGKQENDRLAWRREKHAIKKRLAELKIKLDQSPNVIATLDVKMTIRKQHDRYVQLKRMLDDTVNVTQAATPGDLDAIRQEKKDIQRQLLDFESEFKARTGRSVSSVADREPIADAYARYRQLKNLLDKLAK